MVNPEKETLIKYRYIDLFDHHLAPKTGRLFKLGLSECSCFQNGQLCGKIYSICISCVSQESTDVRIDDLKSG